MILRNEERGGVYIDLDGKRCSDVPVPIYFFTIFDGGVTMSLPGGIPGGTYHTANVSLTVNGKETAYASTHTCPTCYLVEEGQFANILPGLGVPITITDNAYFFCSIAGIFLNIGFESTYAERAFTENLRSHSIKSWVQFGSKC